MTVFAIIIANSWNRHLMTAERDVTANYLPDKYWKYFKTTSQHFAIQLYWVEYNSAFLYTDHSEQGRQTTCYGLPPGLEGAVIPVTSSSKPTNVPVRNRTANFEALVCGFLAEANLPFQLAPGIIKLSKGKGSYGNLATSFFRFSKIRNYKYMYIWCVVISGKAFYPHNKAVDLILRLASSPVCACISFEFECK